MASNILKHYPGEKRYYAVDFLNQTEIVDLETLTGTPTVVFDDTSALTVSSIVISGTQVRFWVQTTTAALTGSRIVTVTVTTSGGATLIEKCTLLIIDDPV